MAQWRSIVSEGRQCAEWAFFIDRGGTFTDVLGLHRSGSLRIEKLLSVNPEAYEDAAIEAMRRITGKEELSEAVDKVSMGTTVATNALLEGKGVRTALVTTQGFADSIEIGDQTRPKTFALKIEKRRLLYETVVEADERLDAKGQVLRPLDEDRLRSDLVRIRDEGIEAIAIVFMHAYRFPEHEIRADAIAREVGFTDISRSSGVSPLGKLVPRGETTVADAYLNPVLRRYVDQVARDVDPGGKAKRLMFMRSSGRLAEASAFHARDAILSGPAGGVMACAETGEAHGFSEVIGFDMGGTSTDVCHYAGQIERLYESEAAGVKLRVPTVAVHTVAAGGGSILGFDAGRFLVGPESAGADPGPACYRRGGPLTVTDINVALGRLQADQFPEVFGPGHDQPIDREASIEGFRKIASEIGDGRDWRDIAEGFLDVAVEQMAQAISKISTARGYDLDGYVLNAFGGASGQHACRVARRLGMRKILVHRFSSILSAYGTALAPVAEESQTIYRKPLDADLARDAAAEAERLEAHNRQALRNQGAEAEPEVRTIAFLRYEGTETVVEVPLGPADAMTASFAKEHERRFGFIYQDRPVMLDRIATESAVIAENLPITEASCASGPMSDHRTATVYLDGAETDARVLAAEDLARDQVLQGPAIVAVTGGTVVLERGWSCVRQADGSLLLEAHETAPALAANTERDPATLALFINLFMATAERMGGVLQNTAQSINVRERLDFSCAVFDAQGSLLANAPHVPVHLGSMDFCVRSLLASGQAIEPGDAFVQNNPYDGGSHLPDVTVVSPVFHGDRLAFFVASRAHHEDIGGIDPGSMSPRARSIEEEGVVFDHLRIVRGGTLQEQILREALSSGRYPARKTEQNIADLTAQIAANAHGASELRALIDERGFEAVTAYAGHVQDYTEERMRALIGKLDDGSFTSRFDSGDAIAVSVKIDRERGEASLDFAGTSKQLPTNLNAPKSITHAAVLYVFRCLIDEDIPINAGCLRPLRIDVPEGTLLNPVPPAPVAAGNVETSMMLTDTLFAALGALGSSQGTMNNLTFGNDRFQYYETICSGSPAGPGFDGAPGVHVHMTNTRMTDPELLEERLPVRVEAFSIRRGSGGEGRWCAGDGTRRTLRFLEPVSLSILSEHRKVPPHGLQGGRPGSLGVTFITRADGSEERLAGSDHADLSAGDAVTVITPTGGGFGE
jgi:5-oxoprolinase (ATP-hydrolysing)